MALDLKNLHETTRKYMVSEIQADIRNGLIYHSKYLTYDERLQWDAMLLEAAQEHDSGWLAQQLRNKKLAVPVILTQDRRGAVKRTLLQPENLADSEFNRYYIRGLCLRAIAEDIPQVITYRTKSVRQAKSSVGLPIDPKELLEDLSEHKLRTEHDVPSNPNSGISICLP